MEVPSASAVMPFLRSCEKECEKPIQGELKGEIPKWLKGCLIRVGSGLLQIGPDRFNHVFDGMALLHRFSFEDGNVTYQNRFLRSDAYRSNMKANRIVVSEFATRGVPDPCKTIFQRFASIFDVSNFTDNDLVNVIMFSNEAYACSETNNIWKIDTETLESIHKVNLQKFVPVDAAIAHAHEDTDGTVYNVGSNYGYNCYYNIIKFPPKDDKSASPFDKGSVVCRIPSSKAWNLSYHHSFAMTENYFVFVEQPLYMSVPKLAFSYFIAHNFSDAMHWNPKTQSIFHVVRRSDGKLLDKSYVTPAFFVFHHINAYEEDNHLVVDLCGYDDGEIVKTLYTKALEELFSKKEKNLQPFASNSRRYVLPLNVDPESTNNHEENLVKLPNSEATAILQPDGKILCTYESLTGTETWSPELPRINYEKFNGKKYRYFYSMGRNLSREGVHLLKVDVQNKTSVTWTEDGAIPSEPVFLQDPDRAKQGEDSGVLLASLLYMDDETKVSIIVLNAETMKEIGRVTFKTTAKVPGDFHGIFVPKI